MKIRALQLHSTNFFRSSFEFEKWTCCSSTFLVSWSPSSCLQGVDHLVRFLSAAVHTTLLVVPGSWLVSIKLLKNVKIYRIFRPPAYLYEKDGAGAELTSSSRTRPISSYISNDVHVVT